MATQNLIDYNTLSPKFKDLYAKAKDFVEVDYFLFSIKTSINMHFRMTVFLLKKHMNFKWG